jgi:aldehyde dehydrogenase (NAD+)
MQIKKTDIKKIVKSQRDYFMTRENRDVNFRINCLIRLKETILKNETLIADALFKDFKRSQFESYATETGMILEEVNFAIKNLFKWVKPVKVRNSLALFSSQSEFSYEPYGETLIIGAWNYPFALSIVPLIGAISAGNCCIVKPSEITIHSSRAIQKILKEAFHQKHVAVIEGGVETSTALLNERFDYIFFTGGTNVGKIVSKAAAKNLTPITLELGGKSPCIIDDVINLKTTAKRVVGENS